MYRFALTLALSAAVLAPAARSTSSTGASARSAQQSSSTAQRSGYIIASS
jgi:hypothetical protein